MKKAILFICVLLTSFAASAQFGGQRQNRFNRQPPASPPSDSQIEAAEKKAEERRQEFVANFLTTLEADDFTKEILKQNMNDYFEKVKVFMKQPFENSVQRKDAFEAFRREHFKESRSLLSENDQKKLDDFFKGEFDETEVKKKKKKKKRKKKKKGDDDN
ncbi:hypothetical protein [Winogradskyella jejuensis]|uniref:Uncharacterized protein n=1 Tax=Winogradskyella jejuensis TaxID=1089305 RepID=A0A1M5UIS2_9FLAO|nr:hypothetical protein [Winogradskyella jejuensis]SHH62877.1 hypothetical protein SAMN05444148_2499 [Winogradskyella jejuensis]